MMVVTLMPVTAAAQSESVEPTLPAGEYAGSSAGAAADGEDTAEDNTASGTDSTGDSSAGVPSEPSSDEMTSTEPATEPTTEPTTGTTTIYTGTTQPTKSAKAAWKTPSGTKAAKLALCCDPFGKMFNLTTAAGQKLYGYDTLQGACANKGYGYFTLYNRKVNKVKLVKVRLKDMKVVKVSAALGICHANEITYNTKKNYIVVANGDPKPKRLTVISPSTLKIKFHKTISMKGKIKGMSKRQKKKFKGVSAIAYNAKHNCYICYIKGSHELLFLNTKFKPYKRVKENARTKMMYQGMDSYKDTIMVCQSFVKHKNYNLVTVYNMKGKKKAKFTIPKGNGHELETVFHDGRQFYAGFYRCYGASNDTKGSGIQRINYIYRITNL